MPRPARHSPWPAWLGQVVAIEPMAIWCSNCKAQQDTVKQAYAEIESDGVRYISLGIDPGENPEALAKYAEKRGYQWTFVQSPIELSRALNDDFGAQVLSAPSTPLIVLDAEGAVVTQTVGFHGPDELLALLDEAAAVTLLAQIDRVVDGRAQLRQARRPDLDGASVFVKGGLLAGLIGTVGQTARWSPSRWAGYRP